MPRKGRGIFTNTGELITDPDAPVTVTLPLRDWLRIQAGTVTICTQTPYHLKPAVRKVYDETLEAFNEALRIGRGDQASR
jgi:hypothetical protein